MLSLVWWLAVPPPPQDDDSQEPEAVEPILEPPPTPAHVKRD